MGKVKNLLSDMSDDDFVDCVCGILVIRGKDDVARRLHAAYYGLGADKAHSQEPPSIPRDQSFPGTASNDGGSKSPLSGNGRTTGDNGTPSAQLKAPYFRGLYSDTTD